MTGPIQHFRCAIWQAWQDKVAIDLCKRKGCRREFCIDVRGSQQLLNSSHLRDREKMLLRATLSGEGVWNGLLLSKAKIGDIKCRFCDAANNDGHLCWECPFSHLPHHPFWNFVGVLSLPLFFLMKQDCIKWPRCMLWHGWLPGLTARTSGSPLVCGGQRPCIS